MQDRKTYVIDIDGVVATTINSLDYSESKPITTNIIKINKLYEEGSKIIMFTARGYVTGIDWREITEQQFKDWGLKYDELHFGKPAADYYIDDKLISIEDI